MRLILSLVVAASALAACQSDDQFKQQWRTTAVNACVEQARSQPMPAGLDAGRVCNCSIDRIMEGKSADELRRHQGGAADAEAARQCATEAMTAAAGAPATPASNASAGAAEAPVAQ